jgi:hypothetical protein
MRVAGAGRTRTLTGEVGSRIVQATLNGKPAGGHPLGAYAGWPSTSA